MTTLSEILEVVRARLAVPIDQWVVDVDTLAAHEATTPALERPRYVWVPTRDGFGAPERAGGRQRALFTRNAGVELHMWADNVQDGETRLNAILVALHAEMNTSFQPGAVNWPTGPSLVGRGFLVTFEATIKIPVCAAANGVVRITAVAPDNTDTVVGDGKPDWGESS
jgi:hypothetical protein